MVEITPFIFYDAIEVYHQQGLSDSSGHVILLQVEMNKKKQAAKQEISKYYIDLGSLVQGIIKNAHRLYKLRYKVESVFNDMAGNHTTDKVYGGKCHKDTNYAFFSLKNKMLLPVVVHQRPVPITTNNVRHRDAEHDITAKNREAKWASEERATTQDTQIALINTTMLQQQEQMQLQQEEMLCQHQEMVEIARLSFQGNTNNNANFGQQVWESAGLAFADAILTVNIHMVADGDDVLSQNYTSQMGYECMDADDLSIFGNIPDDVALELQHG
jgi:hypothetical protein